MLYPVCLCRFVYSQRMPPPKQRSQTNWHRVGNAAVDMAVPNRNLGCRSPLQPITAPDHLLDLRGTIPLASAGALDTRR